MSEFDKDFRLDAPNNYQDVVVPLSVYGEAFGSLTEDEGVAVRSVYNEALVRINRRATEAIVGSTGTIDSEGMPLTDLPPEVEDVSNG